jgi:excisionase family DNA binding protein
MHSTPIPSTKAGWRPKEWADATGVSRSYTYELMDANRIHSVKLGSARIITTSPQQFLASLAEEAA